MRSRISIVVLLSCFGGLIGCNELKLHRKADGRLVPDDWSSAPIKNVGQDRATRHLHYDSVYVSEPFQILTKPPQWGTGYFRFWPDGQVLKRYRYGAAPDRRIPTAEEADNFRDASVGRYVVIGDEITIVTFGVDEAGWKWTTQKWKIAEDGSFSIGSNVVRRNRVEGMKRFADW